MRPSPAVELARDFLAYCEKYPQQRFWQALCNWSGSLKVGVMGIDRTWEDTWHWLGKGQR